MVAVDAATALHAAALAARRPVPESCGCCLEYLFSVFNCGDLNHFLTYKSNQEREREREKLV